MSHGLQPMKWVNDFPVIGNDADGDGTGEPVLAFKKPNVGKNYPVATPAESDEFNDSNIKVNLVPYSNTFEGQERNSGEQVFFLTRVLMDEKGENSFFTVFKFFGTYHVFCRKTKNNKWEIRKVIPDDDNKLRLE